MVQDLVDPVVVVANAEIAGLDLERFAYAEERVEDELLRHDAEQPACATVILDHIVAEYARGAAVGAGQPGEDGDQGRLARAVGTEQAEELTRFDNQIDARERLDRTKATRDVDDVDSRGHAGNL